MPKKMRTRGARWTTRAAVLVAVMGWAEDRDREPARRAGFDRHFAKPVGVEQIVYVLAEIT